MAARIETPMQREEVEIDDRRAMTPARKRRIWEAWKGKCWFCRMPVPVEGPEVVYDHVTQLWLKGSDADEDIGPIHAEPCNKLKTAADATQRAKTKRQKAKHDGTWPESKAKIRGGKFRPTRDFRGRDCG
jgi:5-methylcytosine-specific restriction protein A